MIDLKRQVTHEARRTKVLVFTIVKEKIFFSVLLFEARFPKKDGSILGKLLSVFAKQAYRVGDLAA